MSCPSKHLDTIFISASEKSLLGWEFKGQNNNSFYSLSTKKLYNAGYMGLIEDINICFKILLIFKYLPWNLFTCLKSLKYFSTSFGVSSLDELQFCKEKNCQKMTFFISIIWSYVHVFLMCISWQTTILTKVSLIIICWHLILNCKRIGTSNKHCLKHPSNY